MVANDATTYTFPDGRGTCGFCGKEEGGYAKKDAAGKWQAACWKCVRPAEVGASQVKRKIVGTVFTDVDADVDVELPAKKKNPGIPPSNYRPKVN